MSGYDPHQQRDWHGRWTDTGNEGGSPKAKEGGRDEQTGSVDDDPDEDDVTIIDDDTIAPAGPDNQVRLRPSEPDERRNDELVTLLEWIANAKPGEEADIREDIQRLVANQGDQTLAAILHNRLSRIVRTNPTREQREAILQQLATYASRDPTAIGDFAATAIGAAPIGKLLDLSRLQRIVIRPGAPPVLLHRYWVLGWAARGVEIEKIFGPLLARNYPTIDMFVLGMATSIKSLNLTLRSYRSGKGLSRQINQYVDKLAKFEESNHSAKIIKPGDVKARQLILVIPKGASSPSQRAVIRASTERAKKRGVRLTIHEL